jgi:hypothetical protein
MTQSAAAVGCALDPAKHVRTPTLLYFFIPNSVKTLGFSSLAAKTS